MSAKFLTFGVELEILVRPKLSTILKLRMSYGYIPDKSEDPGHGRREYRAKIKSVLGRPRYPQLSLIQLTLDTMFS